MTDPNLKAKAREVALALLGGEFHLWRESFAEERRKGTSEATIKAAVDAVVANVERQRGKIDDMVIDEMILIVKECAYGTHSAPRQQ